ncbi:unnamed protein product [Soboliphyme baturini]|uniref:Peptidase S1 domain-containing protein n=1 Tax=Soboliphyme baturini TaxID=241478 RepID=A0A183J2F0_9BILA|nr:unnamed protein product [Soboliphyme baturini]
MAGRRCVPLARASATCRMRRVVAVAEIPGYPGYEWVRADDGDSGTPLLIQQNKYRDEQMGTRFDSVPLVNAFGT